MEYKYLKNVWGDFRLPIMLMSASATVTHIRVLKFTAKSDYPIAYFTLHVADADIRSEKCKFFPFIICI